MSHVSPTNELCVSHVCESRHTGVKRRGGGLGSRPKKIYGKRLGDGVEYHLMSHMMTMTL